MGFRSWIHTLLSAFIGGSASAGAAALVDPSTFNLTTPTGIHKMISILVIGGAVPALAFLHKSPLWDWGTPAPSGNNSKANTVYKSIIILVWMTVTIAAITGCTAQQTQQVANEIVAWLPSIDTGIQTIDNLVTTFQPADAATVTTINTSLDVATKQFTTIATAYSAHPNATTLSDLQAAVVALQQSSNTAVLTAYRIVDPASRAQALTAINAVSAAANTILALVASISKPAQVQSMRAKATVKLDTVPGSGQAWITDPLTVCHDLGYPDCNSLSLRAWANDNGF